MQSHIWEVKTRSLDEVLMEVNGLKLVNHDIGSLTQSDRQYDTMLQAGNKIPDLDSQSRDSTHIYNMGVDTQSDSGEVKSRSINEVLKEVNGPKTVNQDRRSLTQLESQATQEVLNESNAYKPVNQETGSLQSRSEGGDSQLVSHGVKSQPVGEVLKESNEHKPFNKKRGSPQDTVVSGASQSENNWMVNQSLQVKKLYEEKAYDMLPHISVSQGRESTYIYDMVENMQSDIEEVYTKSIDEELKEVNGPNSVNHDRGSLKQSDRRYDSILQAGNHIPDLASHSRDLIRIYETVEELQADKEEGKTQPINEVLKEVKGPRPVNHDRETLTLLERGIENLRPHKRD